MDWFRVKHAIGMYFTMSAFKRAEYIRKHNVFYHIGENCMVMFRKIPLYPQLISFQNNVRIASNVTFITHDVIYSMLNCKYGSNEFEETVGCISIGNNVFIGANTTILPGVKISDDVIVGASSLVNKDLLRGGVYAGIPAKYICSLEEYENRKRKEDKLVKGSTDSSFESRWRLFDSHH